MDQHHDRLNERIADLVNDGKLIQKTVLDPNASPFKKKLKAEIDK